MKYSPSQALPSRTRESSDREVWRKPCRFRRRMPDQRQPVKAGAFRAPASRLAALTGCRRPGGGLPCEQGSLGSGTLPFLKWIRCKLVVRPGLILVSETVNRRPQPFLRHHTSNRFFGFHPEFPCCSDPMDSDEGILEWRRKRNGRTFIRPTTTARAQASRSTHAFCGSQKLSADSLPASRPRLRPPPMITNRGNDSVVRNGFPKTRPGRSEAATFSSRMAQFHR